jgi:hypothetical protein
MKTVTKRTPTPIAEANLDAVSRCGRALPPIQADAVVADALDVDSLREAEAAVEATDTRSGSSRVSPKRSCRSTHAFEAEIESSLSRHP